MGKINFFRRKNLQESGAWLKGDELDAALNEAVKDCPELLQLVESNSNKEVEIIKAYESEREGYDADLKDLNTLEDSLKTLQYYFLLLSTYLLKLK